VCFKKEILKATSKRKAFEPLQNFTISSFKDFGTRETIVANFNLK
jgi:hypothetical protein